MAIGADRSGRIVNANMPDYLVPVNADVPALEATFLPGEDATANPLGVKGLGELVIVGVPAAIANAVFNATGRRITDCRSRWRSCCDQPAVGAAAFGTASPLARRDNTYITHMTIGSRMSVHSGIPMLYGLVLFSTSQK
jgi:hypothetical protein